MARSAGAEGLQTRRERGVGATRDRESGGVHPFAGVLAVPRFLLIGAPLPERAEHVEVDLGDRAIVERDEVVVVRSVAGAEATVHLDVRLGRGRARDE